MAPFDGNFQGKGPVDPCPLCGLHSDLQHLSFNCPVVIEKVEPTEEYEQIFGAKISTELAKCFQRMIELRKKEECRKCLQEGPSCAPCLWVLHADSVI